MKEFLVKLHMEWLVEKDEEIRTKKDAIEEILKMEIPYLISSPNLKDGLTAYKMK